LPHADAFGRGPTAAFFENPVKAMHLTQREQDEQDRHFGNGGRNGDRGVGDLNALSKDSGGQHLLDATGGVGDQLEIRGSSQDFRAEGGRPPAGNDERMARQTARQFR
jgi:hypothetical protein